MPTPPAPKDGSLIDTLASIRLFAGLDRSELARLAAMTGVHKYRGDFVVFNERDPADTLYFVLSGRVKVFRVGDDGREVVLHTQGPGTYFGDMMLDDGVRSASVMTVEPSQLAALSRDVFRDFLARHPDTAFALIKNLIRRMRFMNDQFLDLAQLDVYGRVAKLLLSLARDVDGRLVIEERPTQQEIGDRVGASREMVSRVLKHLKADNHIQEEGRRVVILRTPPQAS
jgi:CRP/FNR family transcriptional regulator, cyclic AMP receptor protein